jgi:hypothetical protein
MDKNVKISERTFKWEYKFEDDEAKYVWKYDNDKNPNGPYQIDIQYKKPVVKTKKVTRKVTVK